MLKTLQLALEEGRILIVSDCFRTASSRPPPGHCRGLTVKHHSIPSTDLWRSLGALPESDASRVLFASRQEMPFLFDIKLASGWC